MESEKFDITKIYPKLYEAKQSEVSVLDIPMLRILAISGEGSLDSPKFKKSVDALYSVVYTILQMSKDGVQIEGFSEFKISPLEALWSMRDGSEIDVKGNEAALWEIFIVVPGFVNQKLVNMAVIRANGHKPNDLYENLHISTLQEKKSAQTLHVGSYSTIYKDYERMQKSIKRRGYKPSSRYHEVYLSDPTRSRAGRLKTIIRQPIIKN